MRLRNSIADRKKGTNMQGIKEETETNRGRARGRIIVETCSQRFRF
jgi:hypothetical protein